MAPTFAATRVTTPRLTVNVWTAGPDDGTPLLLVHGNLTTGGFWRYVVDELDVERNGLRVIAPDMRGFGGTDAEPLDATRGLGDMVDDVHGLLEVLGLAGDRRVNAVGWSMGGGVLQQHLLTHPDDLATLTLVAPLSPHGFGGTTDAAGTPAYDDFAASGGGGAAPEFVRRLGEKDRSEGDPTSSPRLTMRGFFGAGTNAANVDEEFLLTEFLTTRVGDGFYPGDGVPSPNWPSMGPGDHGVLNAMSPKFFRTAAIADSVWKPPIVWLRGEGDLVISNRSMFDFGTLGELGAVPGWPGAEVLPPQPMDDQIRSVLASYAANGGSVREVALDSAHGLPLEVPADVARETVANLGR